LNDITLPGETRVAIAGDWHSSGFWAKTALTRLRRHAPDVRTILHLGDFNLTANRPWGAYRETLVKAMAENGIERILVTPGNHDHWGQLEKRFTLYPDVPYVLPRAEGILFLPRGYRFTIGRRTFLSFGGAASPDQENRIEGTNWWPAEEPTHDDAVRALGGGEVDVMLTHEAVDDGTRAVDQIIALPDRRLFSARGLMASSRSRALVTSVWDELAAPLLFHGHMHVRAEGHRQDGRTVYSLAANNAAGNIGVLDLTAMAWRWLD